MLRPPARLLAVAQAALGRGELALELEQGELLLVEPGFHRVQRGGDALAPHRLFLPALGRLGLLPLEVVHAAGAELEVEVADPVPQALVAARLADLSRQRAQLALDLEHDVVEAREIPLGGLELVQGLPLARLVLGDAGGFLEQEPAVAGVVGQNVVDHLALDHRVGMAAHPGVEEQVADVLEPAGSLVDEVLREAGAEHPARDRDLGELGGEDAAVVSEGEVDLGESDGLAARRAVEDHVFHGVAAKLLGALLAHYPADGVGDVGLAAAVRAHHAGDPVAEQHGGLVDERLESLEFEPLEEHPYSLSGGLLKKPDPHFVWVPPPLLGFFRSPPLAVPALALSKDLMS